MRMHGSNEYHAYNPSPLVLLFSQRCSVGCGSLHPKTSIIDSTDLVPFINGCHRARTKLGRRAATAIGCFLLGKRTFNHMSFSSSKVSLMASEKSSAESLVVSPHWGCQFFIVIWNTSQLLLGWPNPWRCQRRLVHSQWNPFLEDKWIVPVRVTCILGQTGDEGEEEGLAWRNHVH